GDVAAMLVDQLADLEEQLGAARERDLAPGNERLLRRLDGGVDLLDRREVDRPRLLTGRGVPDGAAPPGRSLDALASDPVVDRLHGGRCDRLRHGLRLLEK